LTYTADNFQPAKFEMILRLSGNGFDDIHKPMLGLASLIIANQSSLQWKITMQESSGVASPKNWGGQNV